MDSKEFIARRIAKELKDGDVVNLGIGLPTMVANFIPEGVNVILQSENGFIGLGQAPEAGKEDKDIVNAGAQFVTINKSGSYFDSATSFGIIRGGHVHATVLGALQVDEKGNLANHMIPGKMVPGMGGAMDLVSGAKRVIIAMTHTAKGEPKILKKCRLPLTAVGKVKLIVTEMAVIEVTPKGLLLKEIAPGISIEDVLKGTEADLIIDDNLKILEV
ncbi:3-oxoacid CoA-transferase subunit B [Clostridium estertheticum]|uniref:3-oxoacid CoA-transferase subunit B n=1 Tax=Clostridium estertheticum TaxID=238834 RepID=UPI001C6E0311|nr:3-oxoacid CoA-transferase subunit B [Clostridium estertheticum]MBW9171592.1 3-oxoacid CoA-transferase subunit B [Clostridium estertheticum]WLC77086.1 3-oxoacid CoA-transferase subunit B [Clostridium estertheticum]